MRLSRRYEEETTKRSFSLLKNKKKIKKYGFIHQEYLSRLLIELQFCNRDR